VIDSLDDAWHWYEAARALARTTERLERFWDRLPWDGDLGRDNYLRDLTAEEIAGSSRAVLDDLNDLCVLLLFSVFEAIVRKQVLAEVDEESAVLRHAAIIRAVDDMREGIENGSFFKVLEPYKISDPNLVEEVNQVRRYRNWVAHGRQISPMPWIRPRPTTASNASSATWKALTSPTRRAASR
jgi:hypothetical protein